jgi:hypothetical protein
MRIRAAATACLVAALLAAAGCAQPWQAVERGRSLLKPPRMSPDSVVLDVFFVRFPFGDAEANDTLWQEVDEQQIPAEVRSRLAENGFRAGVIGNQLPVALSKMLELKDKPAPSGGVNQIDLSEVGREPRVDRRHMTLRTATRGQIVASETFGELTVLTPEADGPSEQNFTQAQAIFAVTGAPQSDGRVRLDLLPEVHHSRPKQRWIGDQGALRLDVAKPKRTFDTLGLSATLSPGNILLVTSLPNRPGTLGHHFFTCNKEPQEQRLLVVRLAQTQHNDLYAPPQELKLEEK